MKYKLLLATIFLVGCSTSPQKPIIPKQHSIAYQQAQAKNAWDELEGKEVVTPSNSSFIKTKIPPKTIKSTLKKSNSIPDWFYAPPKSDKYFYGAGEGDTPQQAKISALNYIAGEIQTSISSSMSINQGYAGEDVYKDISQKIDTEIKQINFTNIEIMQTLKVKNKIYLLVRVDKQKLFNTLKKEFEVLDLKVDSEIKESEKYSPLSQLIEYNKISKQIKELLSKLNILVALNPNFDIKPYVQKYNKYIAKKNTLLHKITFSVYPTNDIFAQRLIEVLNDNNYKISKNSNIHIKVSNAITKNIVYGLVVVKVNTNIKVLYKNKTLKSFTINSKGISNQYNQALIKASINFKQKLQKIGINKLLGFE